jgi:DNA-binding phage protein
VAGSISRVGRLAQRNPTLQLTIVLEENDPAGFAHALGMMARAQGRAAQSFTTG